MSLDDLADHAAAIAGRADVALVHGERPAWVPLGEARLELRRPFLVPPVPGGDGGTGTGELPADRRADARGAPGDQGDPAGEGAFGSCLSFLGDRHRSSLPACFGEFGSFDHPCAPRGRTRGRTSPATGAVAPESWAIIVVC